jgi:hypothetical protein
MWREARAHRCDGSCADRICSLSIRRRWQLAAMLVLIFADVFRELAMLAAILPFLALPAKANRPRRRYR